MSATALDKLDCRRERVFAVVGAGLTAGSTIAVSTSRSGVWLLVLVIVAMLVGPGIPLVRLGGVRLPESLMLGPGVNVALVMVVAQVCIMVHWWHPRFTIAALSVLGLIGNWVLVRPTRVTG